PTCGSGAFLFAALNILEPLYESCLERMEAFIADDERMQPKLPEDIVRELIGSGESLFLEFKSTARWNVKEGKLDKTMEHVIVKTVAAFLNSKGGDLLIGVQDDGSIFGIESDQQQWSLEKRNRDFYENWLMTQLLDAFGKQHTTNLRVSFAKLGEHDVCRVNISPSSTAVYVKENIQETLFVRVGNSTRALSTKEAVAYHEQRFTKFNQSIEEPPKSQNPKKYSDFRKVLEMVAAHPNPRYFVLKSIILNNLFGVDIMEEAVEICKLRLFLKLAAQVEPHTARDNLGIEPLPDIDFNIRAGNSLVGYATYDEVERAVTSALDFDNATKTIAVKAADLQQTFDKFRQRQTEGDGSVPAADKLELKKRLKTLEDELNRYLAGECGVRISDKFAYAKWVKCHQPFHWFIEFYGILRNGGFDVIISNPPYAEIPKALGRSLLRKTFQSALEKWSRDEDLYTLVVERSLRLLTPHIGKYGMILPLSVAFSTKQPFVVLRNVLAAEKGLWLWSHFDRIPSALFGNDVRTRCTVALLSRMQQPQKSEAATTALMRWNAEYRECLFMTLHYARLDLDISAGIPKVASQIQADVLKGLLQVKSPLAMDLLLSVPFNELAKSAPTFPQPCVYVGGTAYNWFPAWRDIPETTNMDGEPSLPARTAGFRFSNEEQANIVFALLCSSMGYWWWAVASDAFNLKKWLMERFPVSLPMIPPEACKPLAKLGENLRRKLKRNYVYKDNKGRIGNFFLPACEQEIVAIDTFLGTVVPMLSVEFFEDVRNFNARFSRAEVGKEENDE
ncbi:MAG: putative DNA binding domain-containing protein, partial [Acidobacteriota bacterium]|nr:putative DNA binding domain-containing protein [Acidobacteriota bacterium]